MKKGSIREKIYALPAAEKAELDHAIHIKSYKKGEGLLGHTGQENAIYYVEMGSLRKFILKDGKEKTLDFYFEDELYFPTHDQQVKQEPVYLQALESSIIYRLSLPTFEGIKGKNPALLQLENFILERALAQTSERLQAFQTMNATERYLDLLERKPHFIQKLSLTHLASYLGINNASLSKIRARLK